jgi:hypothetical protein
MSRQQRSREDRSNAAAPLTPQCAARVPQGSHAPGGARRRGPRSKTNPYRGVCFYKRTGRWEAHIWLAGEWMIGGGTYSRSVSECQCACASLFPACSSPLASQHPGPAAHCLLQGSSSTWAPTPQRRAPLARTTRRP